MTKLFVRVVAVLGAALVPAAALAELPNGAVLEYDRLKIRQDGEELVEPTKPEDLREYLNYAHCACAQNNAGTEQTLSYQLSTTADTNTSRPLEIWVGTSCDDETLRATKCRQIDSIPDIDVLATMPATIEFSLYDVITGFDDAAACPTDLEGPAYLWTLFDSDGNSEYDDIQSKEVGTTDVVKRIDTKAPPIPTNIEGASSEGGILLSWDAPISNATDIYGYQALCAKADDSPALAAPSDEPIYQTVRTLCGLDTDVTVTDQALPGGDEGTTTIPTAMRQLDKAFICQESLASTATSMEITGLENDKPYKVLLVSVDQYGNAQAVAFTQTVTPRPATDFWEDLHDRGSNVEGGFCVSGSVGGNGAGPGAGLLALAVTLMLSRRSRRAKHLVTAAPLLVLLVLVPTLAHAQNSNTPYWDEPEAQQDGTGVFEGVVKWNVGIRVGPYTPDIDKQFGGTGKGPYAEMFGGYKILPMLDIDRILWRGFGHFGVGGSIGYMQNTAKAWADGSVPGMKDRERSDGNENVLRIIPLALTATYRLTVLDEKYGIPVIPYIRGGLAYYLWWVRTNGETAAACWDGTDTDGCDADKALGGTIGLVGSVGVAVRAERIDANAAISMRQSGIEHAGFYAELSMAKVDGFGSDYKLSVGDTTWFAGVNFEF